MKLISSATSLMAFREKKNGKSVFRERQKTNAEAKMINFVKGASYGTTPAIRYPTMSNIRVSACTLMVVKLAGAILILSV